MNTLDRAILSANEILAKLPDELKKPRVGIVCGTGLGGISEILLPEPKVEIPYSDISEFKQSTVQGHSGKLIIGFIGQNRVPVVCMSGRLHSYEGYDIQDTVYPIRVFQQLKIETLVVTNAAGGLNQTFKVGDVMLINDHINIPGLGGLNPLKGPNDDRLGPRFLALSDAYDHDLRALFLKSAKENSISRSIHEGTYVFVSGPTYESRAEVRYLRTIGGDAVGMSTVPEVVIARHAGIKVLALSLITNVSVLDPIPPASQPLAKDLGEGKATHSEVIAAGNEAAKDVQTIISTVINEL